MQYEFLKKFPRRMKNVGLYAVIIQNSSQKLSWKQYGFTKFDEQINLLFEVLLYIMEQSLKEEKCTMDDIATYIDTINVQYLRKDISYEQCHQLGDFIVNTVLSNEGRPMYFGGYDFEKNEYEEMHISYVANKIVYVENEVRRTSYYLTDDGYNLLLSTLEIEDNMKFNIHEIIFRLHLEKQSYDKAVNDIKNVFNLMRIQFQRVQEAMRQIRRNALSYSVDEYEEVLVGNLNTITDTKKKFQEYKTVIQERVKDLEEENINIRKLSKKEQQDLNNLRVIEEYLTRVLDEHQKILNSHFDLKILYTEELERLSQARLIQRFSMRRDLYDKVLSELVGCEIQDKDELIKKISELTMMKKEYEVIGNALSMAMSTGYGVSSPKAENCKLNKPEIFKTGNRYGIKISSTAPTYHILRVDSQQSFEPILGNKEQAEYFLKTLEEAYNEDPQSLLEKELFGQKIKDIISSTLLIKVNSLPEPLKIKLQSIIKALTDKGKNNLIAFVF